MEQLRKYTFDHGYTLPGDWSVRIVKRVNGATRGQVDHYYFTPGGRKFRSKVEVLKFLERSGTRETEHMETPVNDYSYIYILTNPAFKEKYIKIGMCTSIDSRLGILNSGVCEKFKVHTLFETVFTNKKYGKITTCSNVTKQIESYLHKRFNHLRAANGEFFLVDPDVVRDELQFIHDKVAPYADLDCSFGSSAIYEYMALHIELARLQSVEDGNLS